jgi:FkbM family methyltransferase
MKLIKQLAHITRIFLHHPLTRNKPAPAFLRFIRWQLAQRIFPAAYVVSLVGNTRLIAERGMVSATGNIYCGLMEYEDMAFVIHFLRPNDLFCDIGANIGIYSVIAAGVAEANVVAVEPVNSTAAALEENINLNRLNSRVSVKRVAVGETEGTSILRTDRGTGNYVVDTFIDGITEVFPTQTLEQVTSGITPIAIKIDVEGLEWPILRAARTLLSDPICQVLIIETNGSGARHNISDGQIESYLTDIGFSPYSYDPRSRRLTKLDQQNTHNTIYIKDVDIVAERVKSGKKIEVLGEIF